MLFFCFLLGYYIFSNYILSFLFAYLFLFLVVAKSYQTLCDPRNCSPPGGSVHGISQARALEWVAISCSRASSRPRDWSCVSCISRCILYHWTTKEAHCFMVHSFNLSQFSITPLLWELYNSIFYLCLQPLC